MPLIKIFHRKSGGVHRFWGILLDKGLALFIARGLHERKIRLSAHGFMWKGWSVFWYSLSECGNYSATSKVPLSYYVRRPAFKLSMASRLFWRYLINREIKMCEMCGEKFAVTEMPNPNYDYEELGEPRKLKVCPDCPKWVADTQRKSFEREMMIDA